MAVLRLFAAAREAAGTATDEIDASTVGEVIEAAESRYGASFAAVARQCAVWLNGEAANSDDPVNDGDEVALLPPVSGGACDWRSP